VCVCVWQELIEKRNWAEKNIELFLGLRARRLLT